MASRSKWHNATWPSTRRSGRRVFLQPRSEAAKKGRPATAKSALISHTLIWSGGLPAVRARGSAPRAPRLPGPSYKVEPLDGTHCMVRRTVPPSHSHRSIDQGKSCAELTRREKWGLGARHGMAENTSTRLLLLLVVVSAAAGVTSGIADGEISRQLVNWSELNCWLHTVWALHAAIPGLDILVLVRTVVLVDLILALPFRTIGSFQRYFTLRSFVIFLSHF